MANEGLTAGSDNKPRVGQGSLEDQELSDLNERLDSLAKQNTYLRNIIIVADALMKLGRPTDVGGWLSDEVHKLR